MAAPTTSCTGNAASDTGCVRIVALDALCCLVYDEPSERIDALFYDVARLILTATRAARRAPWKVATRAQSSAGSAGGTVRHSLVIHLVELYLQPFNSQPFSLPSCITNHAGGSILCNIDGCKRGVKSRGLCWTHGGGTKKQKTSPTSGALSYVSDGDDSSSCSSAAEAAAAAALAMSLRRVPARGHVLSSSINSPLRRPLPPLAVAPQARSESGSAAPPVSPALAALSHYCLFDECRERPASLNGYSSSGFCAFHAKQVTQKNYVFEL